MSGEEAVSRLMAVGQNISADLDKIILKLADTANGMIYQRVKYKGLNAEGNKFSPQYSTNPMNAWYNKESAKSTLTNDAYSLAKQKYKRKRPPNSKKPLVSFTLEKGYKEYRELHGRQTGFVDFTFNGRLWNNIKVVSSQNEHSDGYAKISAESDEYQQILLGLTSGNGGGLKGRGQILDLNKKEIVILQGMVDVWITDIIKKNGL